MTINRRRLLGSGLTFAAALGGSTGTMPAFADTLSDDQSAVGTASEDFGHMISRRPRIVARPSSAADLAATMQTAAARS